MPFVPHTPESLVSRADSKNPATTCKGITSNGRPCRRALAASRQSSPIPKLSPRDGVVAFISEDGDDHEGAAAFFCWQHKEQAESLATANQSGRQAGIVNLQERTSLDTLVDRLGILELEANRAPTSASHGNKKTRTARKEHLPKAWQDVPGPLLSVSGSGLTSDKDRSKKHERRRPRPQNNFILSLTCCMRSSEQSASTPAPVLRPSGQMIEYPARTAKMPSSVRRPEVSTPTPAQRKQPIDRMNPGTNAPSPAIACGLEPRASRPSFARDASSRTQEFLALLPKTLSPQTTSLLLAELAKPVSDHDEPGYIYMFWLTPETSPTPTQEATSSLLKPSGPNRPSGNRRTTDIFREYNNNPSSSSSSSTNNPTILLKIGRASNVQRRMNQWSRQCNHNLSVLRYYPYSPSSQSSQPPSPLPSPSPSSSPSPKSPRKVPHAHKVERLIHLELAHLRIKQGCAACGKEHREWFEVEGCRQSIEDVDRVIRRWVEYGIGL